MNATVTTLVVSHAWVRNKGKLRLHPELDAWRPLLERRARQWFDAQCRHPLGWYAALCNTSPAALLAAQCQTLPEHTVQCWVASPYHAQLTRDTVRLLPEGLFPWYDEDARQVCEVLNPLLAEEGMQLAAVGAAMLLSCEQPMDVHPIDFGRVSGYQLPDRHHDGKDGGRLNRLLSEIQMSLFQQPLSTRRARNDVDVNGLWLWGGADLTSEAWSTGDHCPIPAVATRNPTLQSLVDGQGAGLIISEVERLGELLKAEAELPEHVILAGDGYAVWLTEAWWRMRRQPLWQPKKVQSERALFERISTAVCG